MKIPKRFKLMGQTIAVESDCKVSTLADDNGQAIFDGNRIMLNPPSKDYPQEQHEQTCCHEVIHFFFHAIGEKKMRDDEKLVDLMGHMLHQFLTTQEYK